MQKMLLATALGLLITPMAQAHGAVELLDVETQLLADEADDLTLLFDGYDLQGLYVREAYWEPLDQTGLIFRVIMFGGNNLLGGDHLVRIGFEAEGMHEIALTSPDGAAWSSDYPILEAIVEPQEDVPGFPGFTANLQVFVPYSGFNGSIGDSIGSFWMESQVGGGVVDTSPGGWNLSVVGIPSPTTLLTGEGEVTTAALELAGPIGYTDVVFNPSGNTVHMDIENKITTTGQHIFVRAPPLPGWDITGAAGESVEPGTNPHFMLTINATGDSAQPFWISTDLGGLQTFWLVPDGDTFRVEENPELVAVTISEDSPGPALLLVLAAIGLAARRK